MVGFDFTFMVEIFVQFLNKSATTCISSGTSL